MANKRISNKISISCIDDGTTIHGSLMCDDALSQGYDKKAGTCTPTWNSSTGPRVYLVLLNGNENVLPNSYDWYFNQEKLNFPSGSNTNTGGTYPGYFRKENSSDGSPGLRIIHDLANSGNLNDDILQIKGTIEVSGQPVGFSSGVVIQIGELNANGYLGVINFDGKSYMESDNDIVTCWSNLYAGSEVSTTNGWTCEWDFNGSPVTSTSSSTYPYKAQWTGTPKTNYNMLKVKGSDDGGVLDIATVTCRFYMPASSGSGKTLVYTATRTIDDISDEEYMYIYFKMNADDPGTVSDGSPVSLHPGESVTFSCKVAKEADPDDINLSFKNFYFQPRKADSTIPSTKPIADLGSPAGSSTGLDSSFYVMKKTGSAAAGYVATMKVEYQEVHDMGNNINGIVLATD